MTQAFTATSTGTIGKFVLGAMLFCVTICCSSKSVEADQPIMTKSYAPWVTTYSDAVEQSRKTGRPIMLVFSGSDWCSWCRKLSGEVFTTHQFARWSTDNVIKVEVDFPQAYALSKEIAAQNQSLKTTFGQHVLAYPTVLFVDADGKFLGKTGYVAGGPDAWIESAKLAVPISKKPNLLASK